MVSYQCLPKTANKLEIHDGEVGLLDGKINI
jgi:hypothetical protein